MVVMMDYNYVQSAEDIFSQMLSIRKTSMLRDINDVSQGEIAVLGYLLAEHDGATAGELTDALGVGTSRTAAVLNTLEKKGYAERRSDPSDGRRVLAYITEAGRGVAEAKYREAVANVAETLRLLGEEDTRALARILRKAAHRAGQGRGAT